jgi:hypothetical protein
MDHNLTLEEESQLFDEKDIKRANRLLGDVRTGYDIDQGIFGYEVEVKYACMDDDIDRMDNKNYQLFIHNFVADIIQARYSKYNRQRDIQEALRNCSVNGYDIDEVISTYEAELDNTDCILRRINLERKINIYKLAKSTVSD